MIEVVFIGLSLASVLLLVALGLAITYGAMGVINMAHGEMVMLGAYTTVMTGLYLHLNILAAMPLAFIVTALVGFAIERIVVRRLYGRLLDTLLATWGVAILLQQAVRLELGFSFFGLHIPGLGPGLQNVSVPEALTGAHPVGWGGDQRVPQLHHRRHAGADGAHLAADVSHHASASRSARSCATRRMAAACGIDVQRVNALTFAYGSGLAGVAGVMMSGFKTVFPDMGTPMVVDAFLVVVVGGVGSLLGSVFSAGSAGAAQRHHRLRLERHHRPGGGVRLRDPGADHDPAARPVHA